MEHSTNPDGEELARFLSSRDVACPGCGYNLRGLKDRACPECGEALRLECVGERSRKAREAFNLVPPAVGVGACGMVVWLSVLESARDWIRGQVRVTVDLDPDQLWPAFVGLPLAVAWLVAVMTSKWRPVRWSGRSWVALALVCASVVLLIAGVTKMVG